MADTPADPSESAQRSPADELRDKFRAALERKQGRGPDGADGGGSSGGAGDPNSKASARTSNSKRQREFRRKSGG